MASDKLKPEVEPLSYLIVHPILQDPKFLAAVIAVFFTVLIYAVFKPSSSARRARTGTPTVALVGPSEGGKTALFSKLAHDVRPETHTTLIPSTTTFDLTDPSDETRSKHIRVVDLPGHPRLKDEVKRGLKSAHAAIFVCDVQKILLTASSASEIGIWSIEDEELATILTTLSTRSQISSIPIKLLILGSKTDLLPRPGPPPNPLPTITPATRQAAIERLKSLLTREMDRLKQSRSRSGGKIEDISKVQSSSTSFWKRLFGGGSVNVPGDEGEGEEDESLIWGGKGAFKWEDVDGVEISWGCSALGTVKAVGEEGRGLDEVREWLWDI